MYRYDRYLGATDRKPVAAGAKGCAPVNCHGKTKTCPYGFEKKNGCEICKCHDPCIPQGKVSNELFVFA